MSQSARLDSCLVYVQKSVQKLDVQLTELSRRKHLFNDHPGQEKKTPPSSRGLLMTHSVHLTESPILTSNTVTLLSGGLSAKRIREHEYLGIWFFPTFCF